MMKFLLVLTVLFCAFLIWRNNRKMSLRMHEAQKQRDATITMIACRWCGVHVPEGDSVQGKHGKYCSLAHAHKAEP